MNITIRPAKESDIQFILDGYFLINRETPMQTANVLTSEKIKRDVLSPNPKAYIDIAEINPGEPMGFIFYSTVYYASTGQVLWVTNLYVDPFAQGRGIASVGKMLIWNTVKRIPDAQGVYGCTEHNNHNAINFFSRIGLKQFEHFLMIGTNDLQGEPESD